jgi:hypothetical protein
MLDEYENLLIKSKFVKKRLYLKKSIKNFYQNKERNLKYHKHEWTKI